MPLVGLCLRKLRKGCNYITSCCLLYRSSSNKGQHGYMGALSISLFDVRNVNIFQHAEHERLMLVSKFKSLILCVLLSKSVKQRPSSEFNCPLTHNQIPRLL
jgi:hypothetical protein